MKTKSIATQTAPYGSIERRRLIGFPAALNEAIARAAAKDGLSVAEWLRRLAERELQRRAAAEHRR